MLTWLAQVALPWSFTSTRLVARPRLAWGRGVRASFVQSYIHRPCLLQLCVIPGAWPCVCRGGGHTVRMSCGDWNLERSTGSIKYKL